MRARATENDSASVHGRVRYFHSRNSVRKHHSRDRLDGGGKPDVADPVLQVREEIEDDHCARDREERRERDGVQEA